MDLGAALVTLLVVLVVKVAVMGLGARLLLRLYGAAFAQKVERPWLLIPEEARPELRLVFWSLILFAASEVTCGIEVYILLHSSAILGTVHAVLSASGMAIFALGLWKYFDRRFVMFGARGCVGNRLCRGCPVLEGRACRYQALVLLLGTFLALATIPPLFASTAPLDAVPGRYLLPFPALNAWYDQTFTPWANSLIPGSVGTGIAYTFHTLPQQVVFRLTPLLCLGLAAVGIEAVRRRREELGLRLFALSAGALAYTYSELILIRGTGDILLASLGHEVLELWFLLATAELLARLFAKPASASAAESARPAPVSAR